MKKLTLTTAQMAATMAIFTVGGKLIGFMRELILANFYGAGVITDAYVMAQSIPNTILASIISAVVTAYMPIFSRKVELDGKEEGNRFTSQLLNSMLLVTIVTTALGFVFSDWLVSVFAPGYSVETASLTSFYLKVAFFCVFFNVSVNLFEAFLQYKGIFLPQIVLSYCQSTCVIVITIVSAFTSHYILIFGVVLGYIIRGVGTFVLAKRNDFTYVNDWHLTTAVKESLFLTLPIFIGGSINQINTFIDRMLASGLVEGSVSALNYGNMIINVIIAFTVTIYITIVYPRLNQASSHEDYDRMSDLSQRGINLMVLISVPFTLGALCYSQPAIQVVYERGAFGETATDLVATAFFFYALGMAFLAVNTVITKTFFSLGDTKTAVMCSVVGVGCNIILNLILVKSMAHGGLALATSIAQMINTVLLYYTFRRKYPMIYLLRSKRKVALIVLFSVVSVGLSYGFYTIVGGSIFLPRMILLGISVIIAVGTYLALLYKAGFEELNLLKDLLKTGGSK